VSTRRAGSEARPPGSEAPSGDAPPGSDGAVFGARTRSIVIAIATISLVATIVAMVFGSRLAPAPAQPRDSYGHGALGHRAFLETMRALGVHAERWTLPRYEPVEAPLFVIEPNGPSIFVSGVEHTLGELVRARITADRVTVLVLPKWTPSMMGMVAPEGASRIHELLAELPFTVSLASDDTRDGWQLLDAHDGAGDPHTLELRWPQRIEGGTEALGDGRGSFVVHDGKGLLYVVSDPDLVHSFNLQRAEHAAYWHGFVTRTLGVDTIVIDEVFHGANRTRSLAEVFATWPGVLALAHLGLLVLTVLMMGRKRFGPPAPEGEPVGRGPREVIDVAASVLANGTGVPTLTTRYVEDLVDDLHRRLALPEGKTRERRAELVDEVATRRQLAPRAVELLAAARAVEGKRRSPNALQIARDAAFFRARVLAVRASPGRSHERSQEKVER
jgi:hypothetical protein